ncbi:TPR-like protein [Gigaspora margarita]|uniref:TPR-like protein n=1 Tax=Gigaspora margarita TaxID=4874 RepID=A0A8H3X990_GIGMA|nr:TPR-like protein [Gigaspora margarita]
MSEKVLALVEEANQYKAVGNALFSKKNYSEAIANYKKALDTCPIERVEEHAIYWGNIGLCEIKLGKYVEAVDACTKALNNSPKYTKALYRRVQANLKIGTLTALKNAREDYVVLNTNAIHQSSLTTEEKKQISVSLASLPAQILKAEKHEKIGESGSTDDTMKSTSVITIFCVLEQRSQNDAYVFSIQTSKDKTFCELKEIIKQMQAPNFDHFPSEDFELSYVDIQNSREDVLSFFFDTGFGKKLPDTKYIRDYWTDTSSDDRIRILVVPPKQAILIPLNEEPKVIIQPTRKFKSIIRCEHITVNSILYGMPGYELHMYIDDFGLVKDLPSNYLASCLYYGKNVDTSPGVRGIAVLIDTYKKLTLEDFKYILSVAKNSGQTYENS